MRVYLASDIKVLLDALQEKYNIECNDIAGKLYPYEAIINVEELQSLLSDANKMTLHMDKWELPPDYFKEKK